MKEYRDIIGKDLIIVKNFLSKEEINEYNDILDREADFKETFQPFPGSTFPSSGRHRRLFTCYGVFMEEAKWHLKEFTKGIAKIKEKVENEMDEEYNSMFLNKYRSGEDGFGLHTDTAVPGIHAKYFPILSLGGPRDFHAFHPQRGKHVIKLESGDLLMCSVEGFHNNKWLHGILQTTKKVNPRISIVFYSIDTEAVYKGKE